MSGIGLFLLTRRGLLSATDGRFRIFATPGDLARGRSRCPARRASAAQESYGIPKTEVWEDEGKSPFWLPGHGLVRAGERLYEQGGDPPRGVGEVLNLRAPEVPSEYFSLAVGQPFL